MGAGGDILPQSRRRLPRYELAGVLLLAVLIGLVAAVATHRLTSSPAPPPAAVSAPALRGEGTWAMGARPAPAITTLRDQTGHRFALASLRSRTVAITFWDSHCMQECPLAGRALAAAERSLPRTQRPVLVVISVNPRDTPASTRGAIRRWNLASAGPWHWLMGTHRQLATVWRAYGITVIPTKSDIVHTEALYLLDRRGDERSAYLYPYVPGYVAHDMRTLASRSELGGRRA